MVCGSVKAMLFLGARLMIAVMQIRMRMVHIVVSIVSCSTTNKCWFDDGNGQQDDRRHDDGDGRHDDAARRRRGRRAARQRQRATRWRDTTTATGDTTTGHDDGDKGRHDEDPLPYPPAPLLSWRYLLRKSASMLYVFFVLKWSIRHHCHGVSQSLNLKTCWVFVLLATTAQKNCPRKTEVEGIQGAGSQMGFMGLSPQNHLN